MGGSGSRSFSTLHYADANSSRTSYSVGVYNNMLNINKINILDGTSSVIASTTNNVDVTQKIKIRSRIENGVIKAKAWSSSQKEPKIWQVEFLDTTPLESTNQVGIHYSGARNYIYKIGVSSGGLTAPTKQGWF